MKTKTNKWVEKLYKKIEEVNLVALNEMADSLYEHASPYGEINMNNGGKWVFVNPINKQWYTKEELTNLITQTQQETLEEVLRDIETNQKGQFEDDAGNICWYLDDLVKTIKQRKEKIK